jgi:hypothetical protein
MVAQTFSRRGVAEAVVKEELMTLLEKSSRPLRLKFEVDAQTTHGFVAVIARGLDFLDQLFACHLPRTSRPLPSNTRCLLAYFRGFALTKDDRPEVLPQLPRTDTRIHQGNRQTPYLFVARIALRSRR